MNTTELSVFAARVRKALASTVEHRPEGVFGDRKAYISVVWEEMSGYCRSLEQFKRDLYTAHHAGVLVLHRADLVDVMDPALVAESEIELYQYGPRFHFVELA